MRPERLAELESYYSQNDDLYESHGAVLELIFEVKRLQAELSTYKTALEVIESRAASALNAGVQMLRTDREEHGL